MSLILLALVDRSLQVRQKLFGWGDPSPNTSGGVAQSSYDNNPQAQIPTQEYNNQQAYPAGYYQQNQPVDPAENYYQDDYYSGNRPDYRNRRQGINSNDVQGVRNRISRDWINQYNQNLPPTQTPYSIPQRVDLCQRLFDLGKGFSKLLSFALAETSRGVPDRSQDIFRMMSMMFQNNGNRLSLCAKRGIDAGYSEFYNEETRYGQNQPYRYQGAPANGYAQGYNNRYGQTPASRMNSAPYSAYPQNPAYAQTPAYGAQGGYRPGY